MKEATSFGKYLAVCKAILLCCSAGAPVAATLGGEDSIMIEGDSVSADIRAEPFGQIAKELEKKTGIAIHFGASGLKDHVVTARFESLALRAALKEILGDMNYALIGESGKPDANIQIFVFSLLPGVDHPRPADDKTDVVADFPVSDSGLTESTPEDPRDPENLPDVSDPDPAVRVSGLEGAVAAHGSESIALVLAAAHDSDENVRRTSEELLLTEFRDLAPKEAFSSLARRSERVETRLRALEVLASRGDDLRYTRMALDGSLYDSDPEVRQRAKDLLLELAEPDNDSMAGELQGAE